MTTVFFVKQEAKFSSRAGERELMGSQELRMEASTVGKGRGLSDRHLPRHCDCDIGD